MGPPARAVATTTDVAPSGVYRNFPVAALRIEEHR